MRPTPVASAPPSPDPTPLADEAARLEVLRFLDSISAELSSGPLNLPCFPDIVPRVRRALDDPDSTPEDLVRIAGTEPRLAARLIQTANSVIFNPTGVPVTTLRKAVTRLGHQLVQSVTLAFAMQQMKADTALRSVAGPLALLWHKSLAVASICDLLARRLGLPTDRVFLAGLLHGIGRFYVMVRAAGAGEAMVREPTVAEFVADWHPSLGQGVLEAWGFDPIVCAAVGAQNDYDHRSTRGADLTDLLVVAVVLAEVMLERGGELGDCLAIRSFATLRIGEEDALALLWHTEHALGALKDTLGC